MRREHRRSRDLLPRGLLHVLLEQDLHDVRRRVLVLRLLPEALGRDGVRSLPLVRRAPLAYVYSIWDQILLQIFGKFSAKFRLFSGVSAPIFASKYAFCSIFQNLPDYLAEIFEIWQNFANFTRFAAFFKICQILKSGNLKFDIELFLI